jgi:hypothetical protein
MLGGMERKARQLLECPVGCAFLVGVERAGIEVAEAVVAPVAFALAAQARRALDPWHPEHEQAKARALERGRDLAGHAGELVAHPGSGWWAEAFDAASQVWLGEGTFPSAAADEASPNAGWETYAERPVGWRVTSTVRGEWSSLEVAIALWGGDWTREAVRRTSARVAAGARVFEVNGPDDWHALCTAHPAVNEHASSPAGAGALVPNWTSAASEWDGVHLTLLGALTTPFVRASSAAGTSMLWSWGAEQTMWLRDELLVASGEPEAFAFDAGAVVAESVLASGYRLLG